MLAGTERIMRIEKVQQAVRIGRRTVRAEITRTVLHHAPRQEDAWIGFRRDADPRVGLGVLQQDVVLGFVLLDEVVLEKQRIGLRIHYGILDVGYLGYQKARLGVEPLRRDEILVDTLEQVLGLAHIYHIPRGVIISVNSRGMR